LQSLSDLFISKITDLKFDVRRDSIDQILLAGFIQLS